MIKSIFFIPNDGKLQKYEYRSRRFYDISLGNPRKDLKKKIIKEALETLNSENNLFLFKKVFKVFQKTLEEMSKEFVKQVGKKDIPKVIKEEKNVLLCNSFITSYALIGMSFPPVFIYCVLFFIIVGIYVICNKSKQSIYNVNSFLHRLFIDQFLLGLVYPMINIKNLKKETEK